jgi:hypothetical protein
MTDSTSDLITEARLAYQTVKAKYDSVDINEALTLEPEVIKAKQLVEKLEAKQLKDNVVITDADVQKMKDLRDEINSAAMLQQGLTKLVSILV